MRYIMEYSILSLNSNTIIVKLIAKNIIQVMSLFSIKILFSLLYLYIHYNI